MPPAAILSSMSRRLITIPISHYCEKARWALDRADVGYTEVSHLQGFHVIASKRAGGSGTTPVLVTDDAGVLRESADAVAYASAHGPPELGLYGDGPGEREEVFRLERDFDEDLGPHGRLWMYQHLLDRPDLAAKYGCEGVPGWQRRLLPPMFGVMGRFISQKLGVNAAAAVESEQRVDATFDRVAERLGHGRPYLVGERFSAADLAFAALAGAVLMPPQWGVPLPQPDELPPVAAAKVRELRKHPAGQFALRMFEQERPVGQRSP
jgi:glutathione S-transferase